MSDALRREVTEARRIVVKVGSSSLTTPDGQLDTELIDALVDHIAGRRAAGDEVLLVSSGAIAAGLAPLGLASRPRDLATQQAAASVGQGLLVHHYRDAFARHGLVTGQVLLTVEDVTRRQHYRNSRQTFTKLLELGVVPVVNENDTVATSEIRFGDNDRLAALVAHQVRADLLVLLSDVDGLYTAKPGTPGAELITEVRSADDVLGVDISATGSAVGTGGMVTKTEAARIATGAGIPTVLTSAALVGAALAGEPVGTLFHVTGRHRKPLQNWLAHAAEGAGELVLDDGAVTAVTERGSSLLPPGVTAVHGNFSAGDPVDLVSTTGARIARGIVAYDSEELPAMLGKSTHQLRDELGEGYQRELVHRDDLVLLRR